MRLEKLSQNKNKEIGNKSYLFLYVPLNQEGKVENRTCTLEVTIIGRESERASTTLTIRGDVGHTATIDGDFDTITITLPDSTKTYSLNFSAVWINSEDARTHIADVNPAFYEVIAGDSYGLTIICG